jgi:DNA mismatch endonuclease, patch repair protein
MVDRMTPQQRSYAMSRVRSRNTTPELSVRCLLHRLGFRFRLHRKDLPGRPDIVLPRWRAVVFVHGCFWHRHTGCRLATSPGTRVEYWTMKFARNVERDRENQAALRERGWNVVVIWECELQSPEILAARLEAAIRGGDPLSDSVAALLAAEEGGDYGSPRPTGRARRDAAKTVKPKS